MPLCLTKRRNVSLFKQSDAGNDMPHIQQIYININKLSSQGANRNIFNHSLTPTSEEMNPLFCFWIIEISEQNINPSKEYLQKETNATEQNGVSRKQIIDTAFGLINTAKCTNVETNNINKHLQLINLISIMTQLIKLQKNNE